MARKADKFVNKLSSKPNDTKVNDENDYMIVHSGAFEQVVINSTLFHKLEEVYEI